MHRYHYTLNAATELGATPDRLTGTIEAHHPMTHQQIRLAAIDQAPAPYLNFTELEYRELKPGTD
ncbi:MULTISPECIES: hypothetical protein [Aeromonas]|uniref:hypothetical protein n=1 Tax=Aeromonas TaxID=642 RepID=UPI000C345777|nr:MULTISPECIES: hypothetical protein [Aeromonas]AUZ78729.1 hypothetical protein C2U37_02820 [Aeromonas sp. ASNIH1]EIS3740045.1 hypothetical protein [Aeromonas hydrophila]EIS3742224.1 hypothetical protein [Aeromonas hydrophila]MCP3286934.1 hypothetical protein [Aeromonas hydrophila]MDH1845371.1 hypothetical protein [Aeromonas caviae]